MEAIFTGQTHTFTIADTLNDLMSVCVCDWDRLWIVASDWPACYNSVCGVSVFDSADVHGVVDRVWGNEIFPAQVHFALILSRKEFFQIFAGHSNRFFSYDIMTIPDIYESFQHLFCSSYELSSSYSLHNI